MKTQISMTLVDFGWTEEQAAGLLDSLRLSGSAPHWKPEHLKRLHDWCSAHGKDHNTVEGQLEFIAFDICNDHEAVGLALKWPTPEKKQTGQSSLTGYYSAVGVSQEAYKLPLMS